MQTTQQEKRFYSPQLSEMGVIALRRIAWAMGGNMVQALNHLFSYLPQLVNMSKICNSCKDNTKCQKCIFSGAGIPASNFGALVN